MKNNIINCHREPTKLAWRSRNWIASLALAMTITGCSGDVKEQLGLKRDVPDEFAVERKPQLEVPPEFKIRPPAPGERPLNQKAISEEAKDILLQPSISTSEKSSAEQALLGKIGAGSGDIRKTLEAEKGVDDPTLLERVRSISDPNSGATVVDADAERKRISENKQTGKPVAEGEVKSTTSNKGSVLDTILGD